MPINDNNPERRNLMVTSLGFILYFLGDGKVTEGLLRVQAISITFERLYVLEIFAWVMLFWFYLRYIQFTKDNLNREIHQEVASELHNFLLVRYLSNKTQRKYRDEDGFVTREIVPTPGRWDVKYSLIKGGKRASNNQWVEFNNYDDQRTSINWAYFGLVKLSILCSLAFKKPAIGSWFVPKALFYIACILGIYEYIINVLR